MKKVFKTFDLVSTGLIGVLSIMFLVLIPIDVWKFYKNPSDYIKVYELDTSEKLWYLEYLNPLIFVMLCSIFAFSLIVLSIKMKNNNGILFIRRVLINSLLILIILGFTILGW